MLDLLSAWSPLQVSLVVMGGLTVVGVLGYNYWTSRKSSPRLPEPLAEPAHTLEPLLNQPGAQEPALDDDFPNLPQPERKPLLDALIDVISTIEVDQPVSGDAALAAMPTTRRVGTKLFTVEGCSQRSGEWEAIVPGQRYSAFQAGVQLANRMGALNDIEFSEFVVKTQAFADAVGGTATFSDMLEEVARARELDQFANAHDAQLSVTLCARAAAWSPGYIQQHAARLGFIAGSIPGRMVLPASVPGLPPVLSLTFDMQAALAEDPALSAVREFSLSLDVPQTAREDQPFDRLREAARLLAQSMDGVVTDGRGQVLADEALDDIAHDLERLYSALDQRELSAGLPQTRRLFS